MAITKVVTQSKITRQKSDIGKKMRQESYINLILDLKSQ
jgi:hypothetical protein